MSISVRGQSTWKPFTVRARNFSLRQILHLLLFLASTNAKIHNMKKILFPTDFSDNAQRALRFAVSLANQFGSQITLYHVFNTGSAAAETFKSIDDIVRRDAERDMQAVVSQTKPLLENGDIDAAVVKGDAAAFIAEKADRGGYDLIVMGTEGASGLKGILFGSTALGVIKNADTPVVAIPSEAEMRPIRRIVLAIDSDGVSDRAILQPLVELANAFKASVQVFHKYMGNDAQELHPEIAAALEGIEYSYHCQETNEDDITDSIRKFVLDNEGDLLCLIRRQKGVLQRLFTENVTHSHLIESSIPLLVVKD
jgi:nucleotide-binding universal stress UspA family protein